MKMKRSNQVFLSAIGITVVILSLALWQSGKLTGLLGDKKASGTPNTVWNMAIDEVHSRWSGNISLESSIIKKNCPHFYLERDNIPKELKACRPELFKCFSENDNHRVKIRSDFYPYAISFDEENSNIQIKINNESKSFSLKRNCGEIELPQGLYWGNTRKDKAKRVWHTSGVRYFIDRLLVRNIDLRNAARAKNGKKFKKGILDIKGRALFEPAGDLLPEAMNKFCHSQKKQVLSSKVRHALTFHHGRKKISEVNDSPPDWNTSPYPFGMRKEDSPSYLVENGAPFKEDFCEKIRTKECLDYDQYKSFPAGLGWSGVAELLGGIPEYVRGDEFPRRNIHPSSIYYSLNEAVHKAGVRISWNGRGHRRIDFNFATIKAFDFDEDFFQVGFRCMRMEVSP